VSKKKPKAPAVPDAAATAAAQGKMNIDTAIANANLNRIDQYTPEGSLTFQQIGTNPDGTPKYSSTQTYSPDQQKLYQNELDVSNALSGISKQGIQRVSDTMATPFNYDNLNPLQTGIKGAGEGIQTGYDPAGQQQTSFDKGWDIQRGLDYSSLGALPTNQDYATEAKRAQDAVYAQAQSRLDPRFEEESRRYAATLAGKGISDNSEAYKRAMDAFARQKTDAYNQAQYSSIAAGGQEQSRLFGLALAGRQQGASEIENAGGFANAAQGQNFSQNQALGEFANMAQSEQNRQNMGQAAFGNTAQGQAFGQNQVNAQFGNQARQQGAQEAAYLRNLPLNEVSALMGAAGGVTAPQFADYNATNVANTDYSGLVQNQYNNQNAVYQQKMASRNAGLGSIFGLAGSLGGAAIMSDRRVKHGIKAIGKLANGLTTYVFSYLGSKAREFGVMADEVFKVIPSAVIFRPDGLLMVDYRKVW
jgi:hypothetical protein